MKTPGLCTESVYTPVLIGNMVLTNQLFSGHLIAFKFGTKLSSVSRGEFCTGINEVHHGVLLEIIPTF